MEALLLSAGPAGVLALILWRVFNRLLDDYKAHNTAIVEQMKQDRDTLTAEMKADRAALAMQFEAMRAEHREDLQAVHSRISELRRNIEKETA